MGVVLAGLPFPSDAYDRVHLWHRSLGEIAFLAILTAIVWRRIRPPVWPAPWPAAPPVTRLLGRAHDWGAFVLLALCALHIAAAFRRQFVRRERIIQRIV